MNGGLAIITARVSTHPPIFPRPTALWHPTAEGPAPWKKAHDQRVLTHLQSKLHSPQDRIDSGILGLLPYRPDLVRHLGPAALDHAELRTVVLSHPACGLGLLSGHYEATADTIEPSLAGSGEAVYRLLEWSAHNGQALRQPASFYRQSLVADSYWGLLHARRTRDAALAAEIYSRCDDERHRHAAAAAYFLVRHPREPVAPFREVLLSQPFYAYCALPPLKPRGFMVEAKDMREARWAYHFASSPYTSRPNEFLPQVEEDPGWAIELATARGWMGHAAKLGKTLRMVADRPEHPLQGPALQFLAAAIAALPRAEPRARRKAVLAGGGVPRALRSGQTAEAQALGSLQIAKNTEVWRPSPEQMQSAAFRAIVGSPHFTRRGLARGTILDSVEDGFAEIKTGTSVLNSTYQLRLQTYRAVVEERPFKIYTNRPVDPQFGQWLNPWGVQIEPLPGPLE